MRLYYSFVFLISNLGFSQVGIGTTSPNATLDVVSKVTTVSKDGVLLPKVTKQQLQDKEINTYGTNQNGTVVYVNSVFSDNTGASISQVEFVGSTGYYFYNSATSKWMPLSYFQDMRIVGSNNHITSDGGFNSTGTSIGSGNNNIAIGNSTLKSITSGSNLIAIGNNSLSSITASSGAIGIGYYALSKYTGSEGNVAVGYNSLASTVDGNYNTAVGNGALKNATSGNNTAFGFNTLNSLTTGSLNTAVGTGSFINLQTGGNNVGLGYRTGYNIKSGSENTLIGYFTGSYVGGTDRTFRGNTMVGASIIFPNAIEGYHLSTDYRDNVFLGSSILGNKPQATLKSINNSTFLGQNIDIDDNLSFTELTNATAIGSGARIAQSNSIVMGRATDFVSIGHNKPTNSLHIKSTSTTTDPVRIEGLRTTTTSYEYVVIDNTGVLKKIAGPALRNADINNTETVNYEKQTFQYNQVNIPVNVNSKEQIFNIYDLYSIKIDKSISSIGAKKINKLTNSQLEYFITDYDSELITDLKINNEGLLNYKLKNTGDNNIKITVMVREK